MMLQDKPKFSFLFIWSCLLITAAVLVVLFWRGLFGPSEGRYAEAPREMAATENWQEMRLMGVRYYEKPPLAYWTVVPFLKTLGSSEQAIRLPLFLHFVALLLVFYLSAKKKWHQKDSLVAISVTLANVGMIMGFGLLMTDPFLTLWFSLTCLSAFFAFQHESKHKTLLLVAAALFASLGFLTKGVVAIVLPVAIVAIWLLLERRFKLLFTPSLFPAIAVLFAILVPTLFFIERSNPDFFKRFIYEEHIARFLGSRDQQLHPQPFYFFLVILPVLAIPWSIFFIRAGLHIKATSKKGLDSFSKYLLVWVGVVIVFFSASTGKLMAYILPALPPLMMLLGKFCGAPEYDGTKRDKWLWQTGLYFMVFICLLTAVFWVLSGTGKLPLGDGHSYSASKISLIVFLPFIVTFLLVLLLKKTYSFEGPLATGSSLLLAAALLLSPLPGKDFNVLLHMNSSHVFKELASRMTENDNTIMFWMYRPDLAFYTQRVPIPFQTQNELKYGMEVEPEKRDLQSKEELMDLINNATGRLFAIVEHKHLESRFNLLNLPHILTDIPSDPDMIVFELLTDHTPQELRPPDR